MKWADKYNPDMLWLHNLHGYYINYELLFGWIKSRPQIEVKWTLHDCWAFTGHCSHYSYAKCNKWKEQCFDCPQKKEYPASLLLDNSKNNYDRKKKAFTGVEDFTIITPSQWLDNQVKESFLKGYSTKTRHNEINKRIFRPTIGDFRERNHLNHKTIVLGVANVWNERKGLYDFIKLSKIAFTHLENDLLEGLVNDGHEVEILCPIPTRGVNAEVIQEYKKKKKETLYSGHVHVKRFWAPQEGKNPFIRALRYFWCNLRTYQIGKTAKDVDVVFANSTPPTQGLIAAKVSKSLKVPFVYSLQDIFPDSLLNAGMTKKGSLVWKIGRVIENETYRSADTIVTISNGFKENISKKALILPKS